MNGCMDVLIDKWMDNYTHHKTNTILRNHIKNQLLFSQRNIHLVVFIGQASKKIVIIS